MKYAKIGSPTRKYFQEDFENTLNHYAGMGVHVCVIEQIPEQLNSVKDVYFKKQSIDNFIEKFSVSRTEHLNYQSFIYLIFQKYKTDPRVSFINLDGVYCDNEICRFGTKELSFYGDGNHLSRIGAMKATEQIEASMKFLLKLKESKD